jgi:Ni,Fe-hydrogenase III large subunit/Ni,Fe-hydrogenase III component G
MARLRPPLEFAPARDEVADVVGGLLRDGWRLAVLAAHEDVPGRRGATTDGFRIVYAFLRPGGPDGLGERAEVTLTLPREDAWYPSLASLSFSSERFEREVRDLFGIAVHDHPQPHRLTRHHNWPTGYHPMRSDADPSPVFDANYPFPFVEIEGDGVYEIPVGPIHAGLIEPGHFRFTVVGESILQMRFRLWFMHRGLEKLFEGRTPQAGIALAERISGDTAVGHGLAFVMAVEDAAGVVVDERSRVIRALLLELERLYNHVGDLGAIVNDVGYGIAKSHCDALKEELLRHNKRLTGHRLLRGGVLLGGARLLAAAEASLVADVAARADEVARVALEHPIVANRVVDQAILRRETAVAFGALGYVARASGVVTDARAEHPFVDLGEGFEVVTEPVGDVRARFEVRRRELAVSARLVADLSARLASLPEAEPAAWTPTAGAGLGVVEGWRGTIVHRLELDAEGLIARLKPVDPSFFNWPAIGPALTDTIVPDFPLCNKSFNASYAGNDL